jgi:uncharacterized protein YegJ (DUF2314 family)
VELKIGDGPEPNTVFPVAAETVQPSLPPGAGMTYFINTGTRHYLVNSFNQPYMDEPEKFAESIPDVRLRTAVAGHRAWISVDLFGESPNAWERNDIYAAIGRILAPFADDDCLAIYCPELQRCNEFGRAVIEALNSGKPLELFDSPTYAPIVNVPSDDPRMVAAVEEARRRWPEFVSAFEDRKNLERPFLVKARFSDGENEEFMWVSVQKLGEKITGRLENSPAALTNVNEGETVSVSLTDLNDWVCEIDGQAAGGFTMKLMSEALKSEAKSGPE